MATVTCHTCGVKPELPEWMRGWLTVRSKSWCPLHRHSVNVDYELTVTDPFAPEYTAVDACKIAQEASRGVAIQLELEEVG